MLAYECLLDVLVLSDDEQVTVQRQVELPFQPASGVLLNGLDEHVAYDTEIASLRIDRVVWEEHQQRFWVDCGTVRCNKDTDLDVFLEKWPDWTVHNRRARVVPRWVTQSDADILASGEEGAEGQQLLQPAIYIVGRRETNDGPIVYTIETEDEVLYETGEFLEADPARLEEWRFSSHRDAIKALKHYLSERTYD